MGSFIDLSGRRFGMCVVIRKDGYSPNGKMIKWLCLCDCRKEFRAYGFRLTKGITTNCGCNNAEIFKNTHKTHGECNTLLYTCWKNMRQRCNNTNRPQYKDWGGRGINVCKEWNDYIVFRDWALTNGYDNQLMLNRIDNHGNYEPDNCNWVTRIEQNNNRRMCRMVNYQDKLITVSELSRLIGINYQTIQGRIHEHKGYDLLSPIMKPGRKILNNPTDKKNF